MLLLWILLFAQAVPANIADRITRGDLEGAGAELSSALKGRPADPALNNLMGVVEAQKGNYLAAEKHFRVALRSSPRNLSVLENLGRLYVEKGESDPAARKKAVVIYSQLSAISPNHPQALYQLALDAMDSGAYSKGIQLLDRMPGEDRNSSQVLLVRIGCALGRGDSEASTQTILQKIADPAIEDIQTITPLLEKREAFRLGRQLLERASTGNSSVPALAQLARFAYLESDYKAALGYLGRARDIEPGNASVHFLLGMTSIALDLVLEARNSLSEAVRLAPENPWYNYALGSVFAQDREPAKALPYFSKFAAARPADPHGKFAIAVTHFLAKDSETARKQLKPLTTIKNTAAGARYFLGRIAKEEGHLAEAEKELSLAVQALPGFPDALAELAHVQLRLGRTTLSERSLRAALAIDPQHYFANLTLLSLYQKRRDDRAPEQKLLVDRIQERRKEKEQELWRSIEFRPY